VRVIPGSSLRGKANIQKIGTPRPVGASASGLGFLEFKGTLVFRNASPVRAGGGNGSLGWSASRLNLFRFSRQRASDKGVFEEWPSWPLRRSTQSLTHCSSAGAAGAFGAPAEVSRRERFRCRTAHSSDDFGWVGQTSRAKAFGSCEERSFVGVPGFRVDRLQNLVSGVWLERRASVAAEVSGRGLAFGGSLPPRSERTSSAGPGRTQATARENSKGLEKSSLPEEDVSGCAPLPFFT